MNEFTYQEKANGFKLEDWEWDNTWIDHPNDNQIKRILYIGDSISCGTRRCFRKVTGDKYTADGFGTSKGLDNPFFAESIRLFASQLCGYEAILFNNGLHGWHLNKEEYKECYDKMIKFLTSNFAGVPIYVVLTTQTRNGGEKVIERNEAACEIAEKYGLKTVDLYTASLENVDLRSEDGVHFTDEGYARFAEIIMKTIK